jgi:NADH dehydrogenase
LKDDFRSIHPDQARILLLDQSPRILPAFSERLSGKAERALIRLGVRVRCGVSVTAIDADGVTIRLPGGSLERIESKTVLWAGGVATSPLASELAAKTGAQLDRGRLVVLPDLTLPGHPEILVAGDLAASKRADGRPLPGVAQVALQGGRYAGRLVARRLANRSTPGPFHYWDRGDMAVIGRASAVANIFGLELWGWPAWFAWLFIHLMYLVEFQSRIIVFVRWAFEYLAFRRGARLITGGDGPPESGTTREIH